MQEYQCICQLFGGKLIFGVSNDNDLVGLVDAEGDAEKISEAIKTHLNPIPEFKLYFEKDGEKGFCYCGSYERSADTILL